MNRDGTQAVGNDVVHLAGHPQPFLSLGQLKFFHGPPALYQLQLLPVPADSAHHVASKPGHDHRRELDRILVVARLSRTMRRVGGGTMMRALPMALLVFVLLYAPYRMGAQLIGGLDPNSTVNAWGGPTYAGALLASRAE